MNKFLKSALVILLTSLLFSCSTKTEVIHEDILDPVDIVLKEKAKVLKVGETYQIEASYIMDDKNNEVSFEYKSYNTSVATVNSSGLVEAIGVGKTIVQVSYEKSRALLNIVVEESQKNSILAINLFDEYVSLYEEDQYEMRYETRLDGQLIDLKAAYSGYDTSIIKIENNIITALKSGRTSGKATVNYGDVTAEASFDISVFEASYYLSCNFENTQVIVGEEDLEITYSLNYGSRKIQNLQLNDLDCSISNGEVAAINGNSIKAIKKGYFDLEVSYLISENNQTITSKDSFRCREKYAVKSIDIDETIFVLDGDRIDYIPKNENPNLIFDAWLKNGTDFDEPVESDLLLGIRWKINEFNFASDVRGAKSIAPSEDETINAVYYSDGETFADGLKYDLSKNVHGDVASLDLIANIYLPKMDYKKATKVTYFWKTNGYVTVDIDHWYAGALPLGGTIDITYDGSVLTETITQTYDVSDPFNGTNYKNVSRTISCNNEMVINGEDNLSSISYWAYESITTTSSIYLSYPMVSVAHDYLPYIRLGNYTGTSFSTDDPNAHYISDIWKPKIRQMVFGEEDANQDYLYYYQDRTYDESKGWTHCRADYTLSIPAINFAKQETGIVFPYFIDGGFYVGFGESNVTTDCSGRIQFDYKDSSNLLITIRSENGEIKNSYTCADSDVINGDKGFTFPVCYSTHCFERGLKIYQPRFVEKCTTHNYVSSTETIGLMVCSICGEVATFKPSFESIDFTVATYGAQGGRWATFVQPTEKAMIFEVTAGKTENEIKLPKINFKAFGEIAFKLSGNVWDARVGLFSGLYAFPYNSLQAHSGTLIFTVSNDKITAVLTCQTGTTQNVEITDEEIINGQKSVSLYMYADDPYRTITAELTALE